MPLTSFVYNSGLMIGDQALNGVNPITQDDINYFVQKGYNNVRVGIAPTIAFTDNTYTTWVGSVLAAINSIINMCEAADISVILDIHPHTDGTNPTDAINGVNQIMSMFYSAFGPVKNGAGVITSRGYNIAIEPMNEPVFSTATQWTTFYQNAMNYARANDPLPGRKYLIDSQYKAYFTGFNNVLPMKLNGTSTNDPNCIYTFHYYELVPFTHQFTIEYVNFTGIRYPTDHAYVNGQYLAKLPTTQSPGRTKDYDYQQIYADLQVVKAWAATNNVTLHCGEFGIYKDTQTNYPADSMAWFTDVMTALKASSIPFNVFVYKGTQFPINDAIISLNLGATAMPNNLTQQLTVGGATALILTRGKTNINGATEAEAQAQLFSIGFGVGTTIQEVDSAHPLPITSGSRQGTPTIANPPIPAGTLTTASTDIAAVKTAEIKSRTVQNNDLAIGVWINITGANATKGVGFFLAAGAVRTWANAEGVPWPKFTAAPDSVPTNPIPLYVEEIV